MNKLFYLCITCLLFSDISADTLEEVKRRGYLLCGISENSPGFSTINDKAERVGFDIDHCKTISAAVLGKINIQFIPLTPNTAFTTVQAGGVDLFTGGATWTYTRDTSLGLDFTGIYYYGGQGFITHKDLGIKTVNDLNNATICVAQGTTNEQNLADYFDSHNINYTAVTFSDFERGMSAYRIRRCDAFTTNRAGLAVWVQTFPDSDKHVILPDLISKEPQSGVVRQGDDRWRDILFWSFNVRIAAEEFGINQNNVTEVRKTSNNVVVLRLLGDIDNLGERLGLSNDWAYNIIKLVGNYNDMWERNFGSSGIDRGLNHLRSNGGLLYALPIR